GGVEIRYTRVAGWRLNGPSESVGTVRHIILGSNELNPNGLLRGMFPDLSDTSAFTRAQRHYELLVGLLNNASQTFNIANYDKAPAFIPGASSYRMEGYRDLSLYFLHQSSCPPTFSSTLRLPYE